MGADTRTKLSSTTIALHWIVGIMMITLIAVGLYMHETKTLSLYPWHKSFSVLIIVFVVALDKDGTLRRMFGAEVK